MSAAVPRYRSDTIFGLPSTRAISRRYQYVFPLIFFGYRLATTLGHTPSLSPPQPHRRLLNSANVRHPSPDHLRNTMITGKSG